VIADHEETAINPTDGKNEELKLQDLNVEFNSASSEDRDQTNLNSIQQDEGNTVPRTVPMIAGPVNSPNLELITFQAECSEGIIRVYWATDRQPKNPVILEVMNGQGDFIPVEVKAEQERDGDLSTSRVHLDSRVMVASNIRLRLPETEFRNKFSDIVEVVCDTSGTTGPQVDVYPMGRNSFKILIETFYEETYTISLRDLNEIELVTEEFDAVQGTNEFTFNSGTLPRGSYTLKVSNGVITRDKRVTLK
jgi:hypothetical protein